MVKLIHGKANGPVTPQKQENSQNYPWSSNCWQSMNHFYQQNIGSSGRPPGKMCIRNPLHHGYWRLFRKYRSKAHDLIEYPFRAPFQGRTVIPGCIWVLLRNPQNMEFKLHPRINRVQQHTEQQHPGIIEFHHYFGNYFRCGLVLSRILGLRPNPAFMCGRDKLSPIWRT